MAASAGIQKIEVLGGLKGACIAVRILRSIRIFAVAGALRKFYFIIRPYLEPDLGGFEIKKFLPLHFAGLEKCTSLIWWARIYACREGSTQATRHSPNLRSVGAKSWGARSLKYA